MTPAGGAAGSPQSLDERRAALQRAKLTALIASRWEGAHPVPPAGTGAPGAALVSGSPDGPGRLEVRRGWVLLEEQSPRGLGAAMVWALRHEVGELHVVVEGEGAGVVARRAGWFSRAPQVWTVDGRGLVAAAGGGSGAGGLASGAGGLASGAGGLASGAGGWASGPGGEALAGPVADLLRAHGVDPLVEGGVLVGEVLGLEVARVADGELVVGVGRHDREARAEMRPGQSTADALDEVVAVVRRWRRAGAERHPANQLARERWLRCLVMGRPDLVGARWLDPLPAIVPRVDLRRPAPAAAVGEGNDGRLVVAVCSTGVDLDLVPVAADQRALVAEGSSLPRLALVVPAGDDVRATRDLAAGLAEAAEVVTVPRDWPAALSA